MKSKVALVTGASRGIGKSMAIKLAEDGLKVVVNYNSNREKAESIVYDIQHSGGEAIAIQADVTSEDDVKKLVSRSQEAFGQTIDILVNNATGPQPELSLENVSWEDYLDQLHFTAKAPLLLLKEIMPSMKEKQWGRVINIGSEVIEIGNPEFSNYVTAKSAVVGMTRSWANELGTHNITVNAVHPGFTPVERHGEVTEENARGYLKGVPLNRLGKPDDIANMVCFLASEEAGFITGQNINVNGGNTFGV
ncbi:SDR family NAD(P)-dependent oxidoreductase [Jeotgalibacillus terrae]|uniref:SDR family NAD(P)-dependent oxidoreductase n=1 Tax=Jeotgalibacillus terrae TaxID=587735 RepID=A0ABW5ZMC4_9BACL|nr:3-oxoacyl-ACP reductase family protein [Jeotgalibacillus terrae]MBM7579658.1 3-oxoacyl-[acyl-carrier protein] reductase [Jeotgalibacillus terrae]